MRTGKRPESEFEDVSLTTCPRTKYDEKTRFRPLALDSDFDSDAVMTIQTSKIEHVMPVM